ncbi:MAG: protein-L-isoaspartate(D-aspartate) O-methyltransferase [Nitrospiraceae bacterium]|nr:MAG: protein-L-isoaspartate(D-aspartate) O-methyltransferase [Nitrospiraceae bacterium]
MKQNYFEKKRLSMVENQLEHRGLKDIRVLEAMRKVPRHLFVIDELQERAYDDCALPIGEGQTISQPYMVACMTELLELKGDEKVLEVGTGSGYQCAVLSMLAREVYTVERIRSIASDAEKLLTSLKYNNVKVIVSDGSIGLPEHAPFDCIIVTAGAPEIPRPYIDQLAVDGRLVIPVGSRYSQVLCKIRKTSSGIQESTYTACVFVPLIGKEGWRSENDY